METKGTILIIDDELGIREGCQRALVPEGFVVNTAATIKEGMQKIQDQDYDLVFVDIMMPDGRGIDLLKPIHKKDPDIVCVIITGFATVELAVSAIKEGAYDFISKPFTSDLLLMSVYQGLEKRKLSLETKRLQAIEDEVTKLALATEELERLDQVKSAFMLMVAHELRAPVGGAQSLLRALTRGLAGELSNQQRDILLRIETRLDMLLELVNDLLSLASSKSFDQEDPLEHVLVEPILRKVTERFSLEAENKEIALILEFPGVDITVEATEDGLDKVFSNLIGNAIKYTSKGGNVHLGAAVLSGEVQITIADNGIGIAEEDLPHLGEEFFRTRSARHSGIVGTGLGLSIVKQFVDRFGGSLQVDSEIGKGSTFTVTLPIVKSCGSSPPDSDSKIVSS